VRQCDRHEARADQLAQILGNELEQRVQVELGHEGVHHLVQRLELRGPACRRLVEARVLDRDGRLAGEQHEGRLVVLVEVDAAGLLRQVEVAVDDAAQVDGRAEERPHRRVVRRKADRPRIRMQIVQAQRLRVADEDAEDAAAVRKIADRRARLVVEPSRDEALQRLARRIEDAERGVARAGEGGRRLHELLQNGVERQRRRKRDPGLDERPCAIGRRLHRLKLGAQLGRTQDLPAEVGVGRDEVLDDAQHYLRFVAQWAEDLVPLEQGFSPRASVDGEIALRVTPLPEEHVRLLDRVAHASGSSGRDPSRAG